MARLATKWRTRTGRPDARQAGYVLVTTAGVLFVLCGFAALAVDMGLLFGARAAAQRAADAGALAGAFSFVANPLAAQPATASGHALATTTVNRVLDQTIPAGEVTVNVDVAGRLVTVDVVHPVATFFARVIGFDEVSVRGHAVAEASPTATGSACTKPWFVPNTFPIVSTEDACTACAAGHVFFRNGQVTDWAQTQLGQLFPIKPNNPTGSLAPGQFFEVAMADSQGGADYRQNIATCSPQQITCLSSYTAEPGNKVGPTLQGVRDLMGPNPDAWVSAGVYQRVDGSRTDTSPQLVTMPVWDTCSEVICPSGDLPGQGRNLQVRVIGFAQVFVSGVQGNDVVGHLMGASACSNAGGGGPAPGEIGPYAVPVRLVRTQ